jgi:hypothetical protein
VSGALAQIEIDLGPQELPALEAKEPEAMRDLAAQQMDRREAAVALATIAQDLLHLKRFDNSIGSGVDHCSSPTLITRPKNLPYPDHICNFSRLSDKLGLWQVTAIRSNKKAEPWLITSLIDRSRVFFILTEFSVRMDELEEIFPKPLRS